jgi:Tetracyclin repressor-like, C-terminal domain
MQLAEVLELPQTNWDKRIAADLTIEMERHLAEKATSIPEMRRFLAVKGYRELRAAIEQGIADKQGVDAFRGMMQAMRRYALERPGMSAATFRTPDTDSPEWRAAQMQILTVVFSVFAQLGLHGEGAFHALRCLRSFVRGFVLHEMGASFLEPLDHDASYELGIDMFIAGLGVFRG